MWKLLDGNLYNSTLIIEGDFNFIIWAWERSGSYSLFYGKDRNFKIILNVIT